MNDDNNSPPKQRRVEVDLIFLERTFRSRAKAEELLSPERESGTINPTDYEATVRCVIQVPKTWPRRDPCTFQVTSPTNLDGTITLVLPISPSPTSSHIHPDHRDSCWGRSWLFIASTQMDIWKVGGCRPHECPDWTCNWERIFRLLGIQLLQNPTGSCRVRKGYRQCQTANRTSWLGHIGHFRPSPTPRRSSSYSYVCMLPATLDTNFP